MTTLDFNKIDQDQSDRLSRAYEHFATVVGWYDNKREEYKDYSALIWSYDAPNITFKRGYRSHLPYSHLPFSLIEEPNTIIELAQARIGARIINLVWRHRYLFSRCDL